MSDADQIFGEDHILVHGSPVRHHGCLCIDRAHVRRIDADVFDPFFRQVIDHLGRGGRPAFAEAIERTFDAQIWLTPFETTEVGVCLSGVKQDHITRFD